MHLLSLAIIACATWTAADRGPVDDFELRDYRGAEHKLTWWSDKKLIVVVFLGVDCPLAKLYGPRLAELSRSFEGKGVQFVGISSNQNESISDIGRFAKACQIPFPILKDVGNVVADRFGALRTTEVFLLDNRRVIRYQGRIDDQYTVTTHRAKIGRRDLAVAIEELLEGKPVSVARTEVTGCFISRVVEKPPRGSITYTKHVAPILQAHCQVCHRPGQIAPFSLTNYREAAGWAETIAEVVADGRMPPWHASPHYGKFANDPRLSDEEKKLIAAWTRDGAPEGDPADLPPPPRFNEGWGIGEPDRVISIPQPFTVPAEGVVDYQYIEVDPGFTHDRWIKAAEIRPGNRAVVHHCNVFLKPPGGGDDFGAPGKLGSICLAAAAVGTPPMTLPEGMAKRIPAGWKLLFVLHYTPIGTVQTDQTSIGLVFEDPAKVRKEVATNLILDRELNIPPHAADHIVEHTQTFQDDVLLLAFFPHMHLRGKAFRYEVEYPDGSREILLDVPRFDFGWQHRYVLAEPKRLPAGTTLHCVAHYDNSAENPANPDPSATVHTGPQSWEEMFNGYFEVVLADEDLTKPKTIGDYLLAASRFICRPAVMLWGAALIGTFVLLRRLTKRSVAA
jgi:peroxiredoxin